MAEDWTRDPGWREWADQVRTDLLPKLEDTAAVLSLVPDGDGDVKFAVELGFSIMMDKPLILVVMPGRKVPERLARIAEAIVEADLDTELGQATVAEFVRDRLQAIIGQVG